MSMPNSWSGPPMSTGAISTIGSLAVFCVLYSKTVLPQLPFAFCEKDTNANVSQKLSFSLVKSSTVHLRLDFNDCSVLRGSRLLLHSIGQRIIWALTPEVFLYRNLRHSLSYFLYMKTTAAERPKCVIICCWKWSQTINSPTMCKKTTVVLWNYLCFFKKWNTIVTSLNIWTSILTNMGFHRIYCLTVSFTDSVKTCWNLLSRSRPPLCIWSGCFPLLWAPGRWTLWGLQLSLSCPSSRPYSQQSSCSGRWWSGKPL